MSKLLSRKIFQLMCYKNYCNGVKALKFIPVSTKTSNDTSTLPPATKIDEETAQLLERLSLVGFENEKTIKIVEDAIKFADQILEVDTKGVEPLVNVLENECLHLREDVAEKNVTTEEILSNSKVIIENYFIAPVGNIEYISSFKLEKSSTYNSNNINNNSHSETKKVCQN